MDKEAMQASYTYKQLENQHFAGGYFSSDVRQVYEYFKDMSEEEKILFYALQFNQTYALAEALQRHPRYSSDEEAIDLSEENLGVIEIRATHTSAAELIENGCEENAIGFRSLRVRVTSFDPVDDSDLMFKSTGNIESVIHPIDTDRVHPRYWINKNSIFHLGDDDKPEDSPFTDLDEDVLVVLDAKETLGIVASVLRDEQD